MFSVPYIVIFITPTDESSNEKVMMWLQKSEEYSTSETSRHETSSVDQHDPETSDNASKLQIHSH